VRGGFVWSGRGYTSIEKQMRYWNCYQLWLSWCFICQRKGCNTRLLYSKACNLGYNLSCGALGDLYKEGKGVRQNYKKAIELYTKACDMKSSIDCIDLGNLYSSGHGIRQDNKIAKEYFGKACDLGDQRGCDGYKILNEQV
jgi:beta-lactamase hcpA (cysteine-rich 28 kDaprotein)